MAQSEAHGCGVACLAMLAGATYDVVRAEFPDMVSQGLSEVQILHWLNDRRWWYRRYWVQRPVEPVAALALALVDDGHWVLVERGAVVDPARPSPKQLADYRVSKWVELLAPVP